MNKVEYFRLIYEYEQKNHMLFRVKEYVLGKDTSVIEDICSGNMPLPSPLLLCELTKSMNLDNARVRELMWQLKFISTEFYESIKDCNQGQYKQYFEQKGAVFGQQIVSALEELKFYCNKHKTLINHYSRLMLLKMKVLLAWYPHLFKGSYWIMIVGSLVICWYLCISLDILHPLLALFFPTTIGTIAFLSAFMLEGKINIFSSYNIAGKNILAMKYKKFLLMVKCDL